MKEKYSQRKLENELSPKNDDKDESELFRYVNNKYKIKYLLIKMIKLF